MSIRLVVLAALAALLLPSAAARADNPLLVATVGVGDGFNIALKDANGKDVKHLDAGTYTIQVHDLSTIHNFHLLGPGVDEATDPETASDVTWNVTFTDGTYKFQCDPHATVMHGSFTVGSVTAPPPPTRLKGAVGPGRSIALRYADGSRLTILAGSNTVVVSVNDRSRTDNFHLAGKGVNKTTGVGFRGRATWKLTLAAGKYLYRSDRHKTLRGSFTVSSSSYPG
jgi:plastocyanin